MNALALVMIVRDEERSLERCLESARAWVDEIVVVDTGSSDATPEIARRLGARVGQLRVVRRFRRRAQRRAGADRGALAPGARRRRVDQRRRRLARRAARPGARLHRPDQRRQRVRRCAAAASATRRAGCRACCRAASATPAASTSSRNRRCRGAASTLVVAHDGYLDAHKAKKAGRNEKLLTLALAEAPDDAYLHYQLGKDRELRSLFATALPHYERALAGADAGAAWRHDLVLRAMFTLKKLGRFEAGLALAEAEMPRWQGSPDFFFTLGDLLLDFAVATPARAAELLPMIEASWLRALEIGEQPQLNDTVRGRGSFLAAHNLAVLYDGQGDAGQGVALARARAQLERAGERRRRGRDRVRPDRTGRFGPAISAHCRASPPPTLWLSIPRRGAAALAAPSRHGLAASPTPRRPVPRPRTRAPIASGRPASRTPSASTGRSRRARSKRRRRCMATPPTPWRRRTP